ncbi:helix-turn-helix domain-containing protein [Rhodoblastus acidophilus]|uniref:Helix-turn-helix domain-containing protein n=1 Tax=Candidatus Rhodoblastus alkanivorans TaxID=2954117 RepID=A0ABS9Z424_9HYPH|nr:helix-turn-helix domain-containing protein [Candidatus Rhodoblastus alkanivorans]MCI4680364.1 helix-turn-helix domain-containing protein [Candidatus Rhodoblastus alkanivorans]MCI4682384.1 helix-turn-helix domain-containing protein [Candidatus Rhodoblastus alkanivorans]MDI4639689.1 helix-turn-helix domain-containing protein [Rhodoblastus acidophilus]
MTPKNVSGCAMGRWLMLALNRALLLDAQGRAITKHCKTSSDDWEEVQDFANRFYMPYSCTPIGKNVRPKSVMYAANINRIVVTRFSYGVPIYLDKFDPAQGKILVLTTLRGHLKHSVGATDSEITACGESFVADCSRTDYWLEGDGGHLQINLTIPHDVVAEIALSWFDAAPDDRLWREKVKFGGASSSWIALLEYAARLMSEAPEKVESGRIGAHLEEAICVELLRNWAGHANVLLTREPCGAAPRHVKWAENFIRAEAARAPTIAEIAREAGVSVRALSDAFRRFRDTTPGAFLREQRLQGVRNALLAAGPGDTVASIASSWGYVNFGMFARAYQRRFGELPSKTLGRARQR